MDIEARRPVGSASQGHRSESQQRAASRVRSNEPTVAGPSINTKAIVAGKLPMSRAGIKPSKRSEAPLEAQSSELKVFVDDFEYNFDEDDVIAPLSELPQDAASDINPDLNKGQDIADPSDVTRAFIAEALSQRGPEVNKENTPQSLQKQKRRFIDPQPNAVRITFDSQESTADPEQRPFRPSQASGKRRRESMFVNDDDSDEDAFQDDQRSVDANARRQRIARAASPPKRQRIAATQEPERSTQRVSTNPGAAGDKISHPSSSAPARSGRTANVTEVNNFAKAQTMRAKAKVTQTRTPWSSEETEALIEYIKDEGCSWSAIMKADEDRGILQGRDQVKLKDKARNIKMDFLK